MDMIERVTRAFTTYTVKTDNAGPVWTYGVFEQPYEYKKPLIGGMSLMDAMHKCAEMAARAAIAAMREPTGAMVDAGHVVIHEQGPPWLCEADRTKPYHVIGMPEDVAQRWRQMIDAALQDKSP